nr:UDP-N-acetylglucosamine 2-epimerase (hydrolyzing) [Nitrospirota bacterium]
MREIAVVTVGRSDWGIYLPLLRSIKAHHDLRLRIIASGMHLSPEFGLTVRDIEAAGFEVFERVESLLASDTPEGIAKSMGVGVLGFAQLFSRYRPDILVVLGDRFDMLPAALAALPFRIPIAHLHGGEVTEGVIDEAIRHTLSKMSHLHFVATEQYADRLRRMGEEHWRILVSGTPALDGIAQTPLMSEEKIQEWFGIDPRSPVLLVTYHPVTLEGDHTEQQVGQLLEALEKYGLPCLFTYPNADPGGRIIIERIEGYCQAHPSSRIIKNAGQRGYWSLMGVVSAMVGNSSSGIIEAPSFGLPVVNIGNRQKGRIQARNVINCGYRQDEISEAIRKALEPTFRAGLRALVNPYGDGHAAERIAARLAEVQLNDELLHKRFTDLTSA